MGFLSGNSELWQDIDDRFGLDFELSRQLVDPNLLHFHPRNQRGDRAGRFV